MTKRLIAFVFRKGLDIAFFSKVLFNKYVKGRKMIIDVSSDFDQEKAIEAIIYIAQRYKTPEVYAICKLLYLADKESLENYGRFIFSESYCAMEQGAVPSKAYDLLKLARHQNVGGIEVSGNDVAVSRDSNFDFFSASDLECLNRIIEKFNGLSGRALFNAAHDNAWEVNWKRRENSGSVPIPINDIARELRDSDNLIEYISNRC